MCAIFEDGKSVQIEIKREKKGEKKKIREVRRALNHRILRFRERRKEREYNLSPRGYYYYYYIIIIIILYYYYYYCVRATRKEKKEN